MREIWPLLGALVCTHVLAQAPAAPPPAALIPLEQFTRFEEFGGIKISPDGKFLALLAGKNGRTIISFIDLENRKLGTAALAPPSTEIDDYHWLSPTRLLVTTGRRYSELLPRSATNNAYAIERDGRQRVALYCCRPYTLWGTPVSLAVGGVDLLGVDDARHILVAEHASRDAGVARRTDPYMKPRLFRLDTYTGRYAQLEIAPLRGARLLLDHAGKARFALGLNEFSELALNWRPQPGDKWMKLLLQELRDESVVPLRFAADDRSVLLRGVRTGETLASLYRLDLPSGRYRRVHAFANADVDDVIMDFADREVVGVRGYADRQLDHWLQPESPTARAYQALQRAFPGQRISLTSATSDGRQAIVFVDSDTNPGDYYLFDTATSKAQFLRAARAWIDPNLMRPKEPLALKARDGLELHGYVTQPAGPGPYPMVVLPHGGPFGVRDTWQFDWEVQLLANRGYAVLQVNYRGSPGYGMEFERAGYGEWGAKVQDDITDATRWAVAQGIARSERVCIYGKVYGGYSALAGVIREPDLYRCAIGYDGVYDADLAQSSDERFGGESVERAFGSEIEQLRARSPAFNHRSGKHDALSTQNIKASVLLIYGEPAWFNNSEHAQRMLAALRRSGKQVEVLPVIRHEDQLYSEGTRRKVYERILQFLDANLRTPPPAAEQPSASRGTP